MEAGFRFRFGNMRTIFGTTDPTTKNIRPTPFAARPIFEPDALGLDETDFAAGAVAFCGVAWGPNLGT